MSLFKDMLDSEDSLFKNDNALDFEFIPKMLPYREEQQRYIALCVKPLFQGKNGKNLFIYGDPGLGKTAAMKWIFRDLEEATEDIIPIYVNCWQKNTTFKIFIEICHQLGYKFTQNKNSEELFEVIKSMVNKKTAVFAFDEIDKVENFDFLYSILEEIYKKSIFLITNYKEKFTKMEERIKSRLLPEMLEFKRYNAQEVEGILKKRLNYAFVNDVWEEEALQMIVDKVSGNGDVRLGLHLLKESGYIAESKSSKKTTQEHAKLAISKMEDFSVKEKDELGDETKMILEIVKQSSGSRIGDLFTIYQHKGGSSTYRTFSRKIDKLHKAQFIELKKVIGGKEGSTSIVTYKQQSKAKKLTDF